MPETDESKKSDEKKEESKKEESKEKDDAEITLDKVRELIDDAIKPLRELVSGSDTTDSDNDDDKEKDGAKPKGDRLATRRSFSAIEHNAEQMVQEAVKKALGEAEHNKEHEEIKKKKAEPEKAPIKVRRLTRIMLGKDYGND